MSVENQHPPTTRKTSLTLEKMLTPDTSISACLSTEQKQTIFNKMNRFDEIIHRESFERLSVLQLLGLYTSTQAFDWKIWHCFFHLARQVEEHSLPFYVMINRGDKLGYSEEYNRIHGLETPEDIFDQWMQDIWVSKNSWFRGIVFNQDTIGRQVIEKGNRMLLTSFCPHCLCDEFLEYPTQHECLEMSFTKQMNDNPSIETALLSMASPKSV